MPDSETYEVGDLNPRVNCITLSSRPLEAGACPLILTERRKGERARIPIPTMQQMRIRRSGAETNKKR
jgi:hypothetical protein